MDVDGNGLIEKSEFTAFLRAIEYSPDGLAESRVTSKEAAYIFRQLDQDDSGTIDFKELNRALKRAPSVPGIGRQRAPPTRKEQKKTRCLGAVLKSLKGKVDEQADIAQQLALALAMNWTKVIDLFNEFDSDGDGVLTRKELRAALGDDGVGVTWAAVDRLFDFIDKNKDGEVTLKEFANAIRPSDESLRSKRHMMAEKLAAGASVSSLLSSSSLDAHSRQRCIKAPMTALPRTSMLGMSLQLPPIDYERLTQLADPSELLPSAAWPFAVDQQDPQQRAPRFVRPRTVQTPQLVVHRSGRAPALESISRPGALSPLWAARPRTTTNESERAWYLAWLEGRSASPARSESSTLRSVKSMPSVLPPSPWSVDHKASQGSGDYDVEQAEDVRVSLEQFECNLNLDSSVGWRGPGRASLRPI